MTTMKDNSKCSLLFYQGAYALTMQRGRHLSAISLVIIYRPITICFSFFYLSPHFLPPSLRASRVSFLLHECRRLIDFNQQRFVKRIQTDPVGSRVTADRTLIPTYETRCESSCKSMLMLPVTSWWIRSYSTECFRLSPSSHRITEKYLINVSAIVRPLYHRALLGLYGKPLIVPMKFCSS
jgi:hypothetical protein